MTANIAVINDNGIALAADSAVTIGTGEDKKTYYTQQKIFRLGANHAVGIMVYNNHEFMEIGWEIIINEYSKAVNNAIEKDKKPFGSLKGYADYFLKVFLPAFKYISDDAQKEFIKRVSRIFFGQLYHNYNDAISAKYKSNEPTTAQKNEILSRELAAFKERSTDKEKMKEVLTEDEYKQLSPFSLSEDEFKNYRGIIEKELIKTFHDISMEKRLKDDIMYFIFVKKKKKLNFAQFMDLYSGVVFAGYGAQELFPAVVEFKLCGITGKKVLFYSYEFESSAVSSSHIIPTDWHEGIDAFVDGIDPDYKKWVNSRLDVLIEKIAKISGNDHCDKFKELKKDFIDDMKNYEEDHFSIPALGIIASLPKSELAGMAEALVNLASLRRHISGESENAGGPVDVALITKRDGFVWIKKKHLFHGLPGKVN